MHITIFEEKDFVQWCEENINEHKQSILKRACGLLLSTTNNRKDLKSYSIGETILFDNLDSININYEFTDDNSQIFNTCLANKCLTFSYDITYISEVCANKGINKRHIEFFFNNLSNFVTDSVIVEWKFQRSLTLSCIKVENAKLDKQGFFPVSYYLLDLILVIERMTGKIIKFTSDTTSRLTITKENIICYFSTDRLESEYLICEQLLSIYFRDKGFFEIDNSYFIDMQNWKYDDDTIKKAMHVILQNKLKSLMISELYPIYYSTMIYSLMNFRSSEEYMSSICRYLCSYSKKNKLCSHCSGLDDIFNKEGGCPLYKEASVLDRFFTLDELSTPEKHDELVLELINSFTSL